MLEKVGHWIQIVSGLVLMLGVVLVVEQLRQTERLTRAQLATSAITQRAAMAMMLAGDNPAASFAKLCDPQVDLTAADAYTIHGVLLSRMLMATNYVASQHYGGFEDSEKTRLETIAGNLGLVVSTPQARAWFDAVSPNGEFERAAERSPYFAADCETSTLIGVILDADRRTKASMRGDATPSGTGLTH